MLNYFMIFFSVVFLNPPFHANDCSCRTATKSDRYYPGNESFVIEKKFTGSRLQGVIKDPADEVLPQSLVEVFPSQSPLMENDIHQVASGQEKQRRIKACWTDEQGRFCFIGAQKGAYILRISHQGFNPVYILVEIKTGKIQQSKLIEVALNAAT